MIPTQRPSAVLAVALLLVANAPAAANEAWIVDCCGADFKTAQEAVDAASDGDAILIRTPAPGDIVVDGKGLTIVKDAWFTAPGKPTFDQLQVRNLLAHQKVLVRGVSLGPDGTSLAEVIDCAGPVFFEEVDMALDVRNAASVVATRCSLSGRNGVQGASELPAPALHIEGSAVSLYQTNVIGGRGASAGVPPFQSQVVPSQPGAAGAELVTGSLFVAAGLIVGGTGGAGHFDGATCWSASDGAPGIVVGGDVRLMQVTVFAGAGGNDPAPCPDVATTPPALLLAGGAVTTINQTPRKFLTLSPGYPLGFVAVQYEGQPGELVVVLMSPQAGGFWIPSLKGTLAPGAPVTTLVLGTVPANGILGFQAQVPAAGLPPGIEAADVHLQALVGAMGGGGLLSPPSFITLVEP